MHTFFPMSHVNKKTIFELFPLIKKIGFFTIFSLNLLQALCFVLLFERDEVKEVLPVSYDYSP